MVYTARLYNKARSCWKKSFVDQETLFGKVGPFDVSVIGISSQNGWKWDEDNGIFRVGKVERIVEPGTKCRVRIISVHTTNVGDVSVTAEVDDEFLGPY